MTFRIVAVFSAIFFTIAGFFSAALAVGENVFVVPRVAVQAQADSATAAKNAAQSRGRRRAMDILLRRLTMEEDWIYLPRLTMGEEASAPANGDGKRAIVLSAKDLELLESGFEVNNEKSSSQTYRAFITYRFKPTAVRKLFKDAGIPYSEAQTRTALVLPVLQTTNGLYLWENNNPWMAAWKIRPYNNELTPMAAPLGDLEDETVVTARQALALNQESMRKMAARYSVSQVIVAHAFLEQSDGKDKLRVRLVNAFRESGVLAPLEELGPDQENFADANPNANSPPPPLAEAVGAARVGDVLAEAWFTRPSGNFPVLAEDAIETAIAKYSKDWKSRTLIDHSAAAILEASAYFRSIGEWTKIRSALVGTPLVGSVQVRALSRQGAEMLIRTYGDPNKLVITMEAQGLALWSEDGLTWLIATPDTAQQVRGRDRRRRRAGEGGNYSGIRPASQIEAIDGAESKIEQPY